MPLAERFVYALNVEGVASPAAAFDLFDVTCAVGYQLELMELEIGQSSDVGDAAAENLGLLISRGRSAGSGGTALTPNPVRSTSRAALMTAVHNQTTQGSGGVRLRSTAFNLQSGIWWRPDRQVEYFERPVILGGERLTISLTAPADAVTFYATLVLAEYGLIA